MIVGLKIYVTRNKQDLVIVNTTVMIFFIFYHFIFLVLSFIFFPFRGLTKCPMIKIVVLRIYGA